MFCRQRSGFLETLQGTSGNMSCPNLEERPVFELLALSKWMSIMLFTYFMMKMLEFNSTYIKAYLPSNGECQIKMCKFLPKDRNHFGAYILDLNVDCKIYVISCPQNEMRIKTRKADTWLFQQMGLEFFTLSYFSNSSLSSWLQFRPIGETLSIPFLNSINVPLKIQWDKQSEISYLKSDTQERN